MTKTRKFIAVQSGTVDGVYRFLHTNAEAQIENPRGLTTRQALDFLLSLAKLRYRKEHKASSLVFVWYGASYDAEWIFRELSLRNKDRLFKGATVIHDFAIGTGGYKLKYIKGKFLSVSRIAGDFKVTSTVVVFDLFSFFHDSIESVCRDFLGTCPPEITRARKLGPLFAGAELAQVREYTVTVCRALEAIARKLNEWFLREGVSLARWYGPSAAANTILTKWKAKQQFVPMTKEQTPQTLWQAINGAYYGGRIESFKIGTIKDVWVYDINSAYPAAIAELSRTDDPWLFSNSYVPEADMSLWLLEYDLPADCYYGYLPHRFSTGRIAYQQRGRGWYYQPEVRAIMRAYPDRVKVLKGYYQQFFPVSFAGEIDRLYERRAQLKRDGDRGEHCLKIMLVSLYGKFAQRVGSPAFRCLPWAGWITSYTRAQLLQAARGRERDIIAFCTDAIHSRVPLSIPCGEALGEWTATNYNEGLYVMSGVYRLKGKATKDKEASRGFESINWARGLQSLNSCGKLAVDARFFVGHRLATQYRLHFGKDYLRFKNELRYIDPASNAKRSYRLEEIGDWSRDYCESTMLDTETRLNSQPMPVEQRERLEDLGIDYLVSRGDLNLLGEVDYDET